MPSRRSPLVANVFVEGWTRLFRRGAWSKLTALVAEPGHPARGQSSDGFLRSLHQHGFRVASWDIKPFVQPKWSIFRTCALYPKPELWCDLFLEDTEGHKNKCFLALAKVNDSFRTCFYVDIPKKKKPGFTLDLRKERAKVEGFLRRAVVAFGKRPPDRGAERMEIHYSTDEGYLSVSFDCDPNAEPGRCEEMTHHEYRRLEVARWADFAETDGTVLTLEGEPAARIGNEKEPTFRLGRRRVSLVEIIGNMLVDLLMQLRDEGVLAASRPSPTGEFSVEELEGFFGWPRYEDRGPQNRLQMPKARQQSLKTKHRS